MVNGNLKGSRPARGCHGPWWHEFCGESWFKFEGARFGFSQWRKEARGRSEVKEPGRWQVTSTWSQCHRREDSEPLLRPAVAEVTQSGQGNVKNVTTTQTFRL